MPGKDERPISRSQLAKRNEQFLSSERPKGGYRVYTSPDSLGRSDQALPLNWLDMNLPIIFSPFAQGSAEMFCIVQHVTHLGHIIFMRLTQPRNRAGIFYARELVWRSYPATDPDDRRRGMVRSGWSSNQHDRQCSGEARKRTPIMNRVMPLATINRFRMMSPMYGSALEGSARRTRSITQVVMKWFLNNVRS